MAGGKGPASAKPPLGGSSTKRQKGDRRALKLLVDILLDIERRTEPQTEENSFNLADEKVIAQSRRGSSARNELR
jgi:hypothetical protein